MVLLDIYSLQTLSVVLVTIRVAQSAPAAPKCTLCPPGFGVVRMCDDTRDTVCSACSVGRYLSSAADVVGCYPCSRCGEGLFELHPCNATSDVFCELCSWSDATDNDDFVAKCLMTSHEWTNQKISTDSGSAKKDRRFKHVEKEELHRNSKDLGDPNRMQGDQPQSETSRDEDSSEKSRSEEKTQPGKSSDVIRDEDSSEKSRSEEKTQPGKSPDVIRDEDSSEKSRSEEKTQPGKSPDVISGYEEDTASGEEPKGEGFDKIIFKDVNAAEKKQDDEVHVIPTVAEGSDATRDVDKADTDAPLVGKPPSGLPSPHTVETVQRSQLWTTVSVDIYSKNFDREDEDSGDFSGDLDPIFGQKPSFEVIVEPSEPAAEKEVTESSKKEDEEVEEEKGTEEEDKKQGGETKDANNVEEVQEASSSAGGIVVTVIIVGIAFFVIGFFVHRHYRKRKQKNKQAYEPVGQQIPTAAQTAPPKRVEKPIEAVEMTPSPPAAPVTVNTTLLSEERAQEANSAASEPDADRTSTDYHNGHSPIDIVPDDAEVDDTLVKHPLKVAYSCTQPPHTITNTGTTIKILTTGSTTDLEGGPLGNKKYCLDHIHYHWGSDNDKGSEHTVRGKPYSAEVHFVHWNREDYASFAEAAKSEDGISVLAVLIKVGEEDHAPSKLITDCLPSIQFKGESRDIPTDDFDPTFLLPENRDDYWTYMGSLTAEPYHETVTWVVFKDHVTISQEQMDRFRRLLTYERDEGHGEAGSDAKHLVNNYRQTVPIGERTVRASFD